jgi:hypothetical protein
MPAPSAEVTADPYDPTAATRRVTLHLNGTSPQLKLSLPAESLVGWSIATSLAAMVQTARLGDADSVFLSHHARKDLNTTVDLNRRQVESGGYLN